MSRRQGVKNQLSTYFQKTNFGGFNNEQGGLFHLQTNTEEKKVEVLGGK